MYSQHVRAVNRKTHKRNGQREIKSVKDSKYIRSVNRKSQEKQSAWDQISNEIPSTYALLIGKHKRNGQHEIKSRMDFNHVPTVNRKTQEKQSA